MKTSKAIKTLFRLANEGFELLISEVDVLFVVELLLGSTVDVSDVVFCIAVLKFGQFASSELSKHEPILSHLKDSLMHTSSGALHSK